MSAAYGGGVPVRCVVVEVGAAASGDGLRARLHAAAATAPDDVVVGFACVAGAIEPDDVPVGAFVLPLAQLAVRPEEPRVVAMAAAAGGAFPREVLVVAEAASALLAAATAVGAAPCPSYDPLAEDLGARCREADRVRVPEVGVGAHPLPWPDDPRLDPVLLAEGDRRNVVDRYRYWSEAAIVADLAPRRHAFHVAVENWQHDLNIGTVVRTANAFGAAGVHIVGHRRWNRRGAMATDRYLPVSHHASPEDLAGWAAAQGLELVGIDNVPGACDLDRFDLPEAVVLVFGQEGPGLSPAAQAACATVCGIRQFGSTRSLNAGVAAGIAMHAWITTHVVP